MIGLFQGEEKEIVVSEDDGIRPGVTAGALAGLKTVFKKNGTTTAGNSSQVCCQINRLHVARFVGHPAIDIEYEAHHFN